MNRIDTLKTFLQEDPTDSFVLFSLAQEHSKLGEYEDSRSYYLRLRESDPDYIGLYYHLGKTEEQLGNVAAAIEAYQKGIEVSKRLGDAHAMSELRGALDLVEG